MTFDAHAVLTAHAAEAARLDRSNPLPFPGVRVGQVWVHPLWASYNKDFGPYIANTVSFVRPKDARAEFGPFTTPLDFADLEREGFLIADPCCPHLAPWSPPEAP